MSSEVRGWVRLRNGELRRAVQRTDGKGRVTVTYQTIGQNATVKDAPERLAGTFEKGSWR